MLSAYPIFSKLLVKDFACVDSACANSTSAGPSKITNCQPPTFIPAVKAYKTNGLPGAEIEVLM